MADERNDGNTPTEFLNHGTAPSTSRALSQNASFDLPQDVPLDLSCRRTRNAEASNQPQGNSANNEPWMCPFCMEEFTCVADLNNHYDNNIIDGRHRCQVCGKLFRNPSLFKRHYVSHNGVKPYSCDVCERKFSRYDHFMRHKKAHMDTRLHCCQQCGAKYKHSRGLQRHVREKHLARGSTAPKK